MGQVRTEQTTQAREALENQQEALLGAEDLTIQLIGFIVVCQ
jgi:hypothetical protein